MVFTEDGIASEVKPGAQELDNFSDNPALYLLVAGTYALVSPFVSGNTNEYIMGILWTLNE